MAGIFSYLPIFIVKLKEKKQHSTSGLRWLIDTDYEFDGVMDKEKAKKRKYSEVDA